MDQGPTYSPYHKYYGDSSQAQPRSFDELQIERSYLLNYLQREDHKATKLLQNISLLQGYLQQGPGLPANKS